MNAVDLLAVDDGMHCSVDVEQQSVIPAVRRQRSVGREAARNIIMHNDGHAQLFRYNCSLEHFFAGASCGVEIMALHFAGFRLGLVDRFCYEQESVAPPHKWLRVDVLVVFREVEAAA